MTTRHVGIGSDLDGGFGREGIPAELDSCVDLTIDRRRVGGAGWRADEVEGSWAETGRAGSARRSRHKAARRSPDWCLRPAYRQFVNRDHLNIGHVFDREAHAFTPQPALAIAAIGHMVRTEGGGIVDDHAAEVQTTNA